MGRVRREEFNRSERKACKKEHEIAGGVLPYVGVHGADFVVTPLFFAYFAVQSSSLILESHFRTKVFTVLVGLEARRVNAVSGQLFVALLCISRDADGADDFAVLIANQHAAALGKNLIVRSTD